MNITFISTINHNIGDDFVREGIQFLLKQYYEQQDLSFMVIHKHSPITSRKGFEWFRSYRFSRYADALLPLNLTMDKIINTDLIIQSGAPVYWCHDDVHSHCCRNEWYTPLIRRRFPLNPAVKLLNIAAGSCQRYHSEGKDFCGQCKQYILDFHSACSLTTVRDSLSKNLLKSLSCKVQKIPCSSIFAIDNYRITPRTEEYIVVSYMHGGGHYQFGSTADPERWRREFQKLYTSLIKKETVVFACHDQLEVQAAREIDSNARIFYKHNDYAAYIDFYSKAKFGILNRVHGAFLLASMGKPSIVIGNDSRATMAEEIGLSSYSVNDVHYDLLKDRVDYLRNGADHFHERFDLIKKKAFDQYMNAFSIL